MELNCRKSQATCLRAFAIESYEFDRAFTHSSHYSTIYEVIIKISIFSCLVFFIAAAITEKTTENSHFTLLKFAKPPLLPESHCAPICVSCATLMLVVSIYSEDACCEHKDSHSQYFFRSYCPHCSLSTSIYSRIISSIQSLFYIPI